MNKKLAILPIIWALSYSFASADAAKDAAKDAATDTVIASVNGINIMEKDVARIMKASKQDMQGKLIDRKEAILTLIRTEVVKQKAQKEGFADKPEIKEELAKIKDQLIINAFLSDEGAKIKVNDDDYDKAYKKVVESMPKMEYQASHILLKTEKAAQAVIKELDKGVDFAKLAKEKSIGPSKADGGSLGWFTPKSMVKEFSDAVIKLKKGGYSKKPIKTQFGYHVALLQDSRKPEAPKLEGLKPQLHNTIMPEKMMQLVDKMVSEAKVVRKDKK